MAIKLTGNLHGENLRISIGDLGNSGVVVRIHARDECWHTCPLSIFVGEPRVIAAWQTLADTLAALDVKEDAP